MRLTKLDEQDATRELLKLLQEFPQGLTTTQLQGTSRFHGQRTLSWSQIARLLRKVPGVKHNYAGSGYMAPSYWRYAEPAQQAQVEGAMTSMYVIAVLPQDDINPICAHA